MLSNARFLVVAFVVSAAISLAWQYHAAQRGAVDSGTAGQAAASDEEEIKAVAPDIRDSKSDASAGTTRVKASGDAPAMNKEPAGDESKTTIPRHEETYVFEYDEQWVGDFYTRLHSPDPLPVDEADALPVISGRVLTPNGRPVAGIQVSALPRNYFRSGDDLRSRSTVTRQTKTNEDGFYAFRDLPAGVYMLVTEPSARYAESRVEVRTGIKYADLTLKPQGFATVQGVVTDQMGNELEQVRVMPIVSGVPPVAFSDSNGEFELGVSLEKAEKSFPLRFQFDGYREQRYQVSESDWSAGGRILLTVTMEPVYEFGEVSGSVKGADGKQAAGDIVRLYSPSLKRNYTATVDDAGEYLFANVEIANDYQLWVRPTGDYRDFAEKNFSVGPGSMRRDIELEPLSRNIRLSGRILDQDGKPVPNYTLTLSSMAAKGQQLPVSSDGHGRFEVENVPEGELVFESRTMPYYSVSGLLLMGDESERKIDVVINRGGHKLIGKVVNSDGRPVAAPKIFITASRVNGDMQSRLSSTTSADADGRFLFTNLDGGQHTITVHAPGYEGVRIHPVIRNQDELVIKLQKDKT
ncbi:MAG: carboxypeptidase-like regulatory domain-containing protein [Gammaproteobacteria bacterium]|jgi:protocatechuate 3,4-dioxygenase beta subunit|nr:carboxypeptidase-like regulatory domain-containing protein [Gammaproteobacteria bacterium]